MTDIKIDVSNIRQTIFHVNKEVHYTFDVNKTITFHYLKRMISAAAHLPKNSFKIYHENEDLTDYDDVNLNSFFPNDQKIDFTLFITPQTKDNLKQLTDSVIKLKLNEYCSIHTYKYLSYYCYTCKLSICSLCLQSDHSTHEYIEKYDYLQSSRHLVDNILGDEKLYSADDAYDKSYDMLTLKDKLKNKLFSQLHEMLNQVEAKVNEVIDFYNTNLTITKDNINDNAKKIKEYCTAGLEQLKEDIGIDKLIINEDIFLTFDKKYKEIAKHQFTLKEDTAKYIEMSKNYPTIEDFLQTIYNEIFDVLSKQINLVTYAEIKKNIANNFVGKISKDEIIQKIFDNISVPRKSLLKRSYASTIMPDFNSSSMKLDNSSNNAGVNGNPSTLGSVKKELMSLTQNANNNMISMTQQPFNDSMAPVSELNSNNNEDEIKYAKDDSVIGVKQTSKSKTNFYSTYIMYPVPNSKTIIIETEEGERLERTAEFPSLSKISAFLDKSAHCNYKNKLYVTGGVTKNEPNGTKFLLKFDPNYNTVIIMSYMDFPHSCHSMIAYEDYIYAIGGSNSNICERFSLINMKWETMKPMIFKERQFPMLHVYNNFLYAFCGFNSETGYMDTTEKINLNNPRAKWELVAYKNPDKINLKLYGCGLVAINDQVFFFGGKRNDEILSNVFTFTFTNNTFIECPDNVEYKVYFKENQLHPMKNNQYGNIDEFNKNPLCLQVNGTQN